MSMFSHVFINCCSYGKCHFHLIFNGRHRFLCMPPLCSVPFVKCHYNFQILCSNCSQCSFYLLANCAVRRASYSTNHINSIEMKIKQWINHLAMHYTFYIARRGTFFVLPSQLLNIRFCCYCDENVANIHGLRHASHPMPNFCSFHSVHRLRCL